MPTFNSWSADCWPPIRHCAQKMAGEAQRSVVSRRPLESDVDRRVVHGPVVHWGVRADHDICWGTDRPCIESIVPFHKWIGGEPPKLDPRMKHFTDSHRLTLW
jgi:hypothetical protein